MQPHILVTRRIFPETIERLRAHAVVDWHDADTPLSPAELVQRLQGKVAVLGSSTERFDAELLAQCPQLKAVCLLTVGYNNVDLAACAERGVAVSHAPDVLTETTADFGFALMLAAARRVSESEHFLRAGRWGDWSIDLFAGAEVHGRVLGVLGMGRIGQAIARRAHRGFDMPVLYSNRSPLPAQREAELGARWVDRSTLLQQSDHVMVVTPYTPQTHHLVGAAELALMKPTATLTNIARGGVVDDAALAQALSEGRLAAAGLDVFEGEPEVHPALLRCANVVLTPHIASATQGTRRAMCEVAADNLIAALHGQPLPTPVPGS
ncbi:2-hydroxyacid dehydrogenase [Roseateles sp. BYS180W]|uniref:2-hydroxyacid dehydrogenase n=1 Tax=Roseateles rivi TaxID=3299028 RepID=A0ABW7FYL9_9BURK